MPDTPEPAVDFLTVPLADGGTRTRLDRLTDGRIMCCICFEFCTRDQLNPVDGIVEDVCRSCARIEAAVAEVPSGACRVVHGPRWSEVIQVCTRPYGHDGKHRDERWTHGSAS
ncbi:hypothetical protein [Streptomyces longwoodensis]|uniref:hypothetical protein n=1 Tax=Streptomyces longwoodensis TaxID=68231 RepID=UPI00225B311C|nr:hypothetical protein [Streptomyces longwoodensis]MCX5000944.1 hypothetical protein [Streptomyces longwoodensis]